MEEDGYAKGNNQAPGTPRTDTSSSDDGFKSGPQPVLYEKPRAAPVPPGALHAKRPGDIGSPDLRAPPRHRRRRAQAVATRPSPGAGRPPKQARRPSDPGSRRFWCFCFQNWHHKRHFDELSHCQNAKAAAAAAPAQGPGAVPRRRETKKNVVKDSDVIAKLQAICTDADPTKLYRSLSKIGQGASGGVFTAYQVGTNHSVAIKQMNLEQQPKKDLIINEILVMKESRHRNIVNFIDSFLFKGDLWWSWSTWRAAV